MILQANIKDKQTLSAKDHHEKHVNELQKLGQGSSVNMDNKDMYAFWVSVKIA